MYSSKKSARSRSCCGWPMLVCLVVARGLGAEDCNHNEIDDTDDIANGASTDCNSNGVPDECDIGLIDLGAAVAYPLGAFVYDVAAADVDGDGAVDLAAHNPLTQAFYIMRNLGNGSFVVHATISVGDVGESAIASGDFDGDGDVDLAVATEYVVSVFSNDGTGVFAPATSVSANVWGILPHLLASDLDGDGDLDLIGGHVDGFQVLYNAGNGAFTEPQITLVPPGFLMGLAIADVDNDGHPDIAATVYPKGKVDPPPLWLIYNYGSGQWSEPVAIARPNEQVNIVLACDVDGDGNADLVVLDDGSPSSVHVLINDGAGSFSPNPQLALANGYLGMTAGDLDNDGDADLFLSNYVNGYVAALRNDGTGHFVETGTLPLASPVRAAAADFDTDGRLDVAVCHVGLGGSVGLSVILTDIGVSALLDCNGNAVPDVCEIAAGLAPDRNNNGIIDTCEGGAVLAANPPPSNPYAGAGQPFRDVLQTGSGGTLAQGIGGATTPAVGDVTPGHVTVTFDGPAVLLPAHIDIACNYTGDPPGTTPCPSVVNVAGAGSGPYTLFLSGPIPPGGCTTLTFNNTDPPYVLRYESLPGDVDMNGRVSAADVMKLLIAIGNGTANLPENRPRYDITRTGGVGFADVTRLIQLLNGVNTSQAWNGKSLVPCGP